METTSDKAPTQVNKMGRPLIYEDRKKYNRDYYHEHKTTNKCEHCNCEFACLSGLKRHQRRSSKCEVKKLQKRIGDLEGKLLDRDLSNSKCKHLIIIE